MEAHIARPDLFASRLPSACIHCTSSMALETPLTMPRVVRPRGIPAGTTMRVAMESAVTVALTQGARSQNLGWAAKTSAHKGWASTVATSEEPKNSPCELNTDSRPPPNGMKATVLWKHSSVHIQYRP